MPHKHAPVTEHKHTNRDFLDRLQRYENAVRQSVQDQSAETMAELSSSRQSLSDISRIAKAAFDDKFTPPEGDRLFGKALKALATAIMHNRGVTREVARERIHDMIAILVTREYPALTPNVPDFAIDGCVSGRIQSSEPNFTELDHLPEGSH